VARGEKNVFLLGSPAGDHDPLFRLGHSDVWFRSYVVPADTLMQYKLAPDVPQVDGVGHEQRRAILVSAQADPLNPNSVNRASDRWNRYSLLALNPARYCTPQRMAQPLRYGTLTRHQLRSDFLHNTREVMIYRPRLPQPARWTLMLFDGKTYQDEYRFANVLDSLIASHVLPPINVVFIDSLDHPRRAKELPPNPSSPILWPMSCCPGCDNRGWMPFAKKPLSPAPATAAWPHRGSRCAIRGCLPMSSVCRALTGGRPKARKPAG
jgi:enterochelin esterase family protein